ncbi:MAG TPA: SDR family oxidoreductase [Kofleriaceae bacterium]|jgi:NAD(P)-dependent dehydrogenase (short-subunit alcohol dehydrogenase family)
MTRIILTALVTGANKGIGFETARQLARRGFRVWLGCRDEERGVAAAADLATDGDVRFVRLDVTDIGSVRAAAERIERETSSLDVLVNNAGVAGGEGDGFPSTTPLEAVQRTFEVNFYGALRVTQAFLPLLQKSNAGRIVNVASIWGSLTSLVAPESFLLSFPAFAYASSKTALNALTGWLAVELKDTPIKINSVCPGYTATDINHNTGTQHPAEAAKIVVRAATLEANGPTGTFFDANGALGW